MAGTYKICEECKKICKPLLAYSKAESSEWYCEKCHLSYQMSEEDARAIMAIAK